MIWQVAIWLGKLMGQKMHNDLTAYYPTLESDAEMTKEEEEVAKKRVRLSPEGKGLPQHLRFD
eukprot:scaffold142782_cov19-Tisochrysis_lutea.AAC.3